MDRRDRAGEAIVCHLRDLGRTRLVETRIRSNDADRRILDPSTLPAEECATPEQFASIGSRLQVFGQDARDYSTCSGIDHISDGVDGDDRAYDQAIGEGDRGGPESAFHRAVPPSELPDGRPGAGTDTPLGDRAGARALGGAISTLGGRPDLGSSSNPEVEEDRACDDRYIRDPGRVADPPLFEVSDDALRCIESEGAATREDDGMDFLDGVDGIEEVSLPRPWCAAPDIDSPDSAALGEDDGAAGRSLAQGVMTGLDTVDGGQPEGRTFLGECRGG